MGQHKKLSTTIIIVGGGVIGLSTAHHLAKKNKARVILLDKTIPGDGASTRAGGIITGLLWTKTGIEARKISLRLYRELSDELQQYNYTFQTVGCLNLFDVESWSSREELLPLYDSSNVPYEIINAGDIHKRWPDLTLPEDIIGLFDPLGGYSEPHHYVVALTQRCRDLGVEIRQEQPVSDFLIRGGRVAGVVTPQGQIEADVVISTIHTWTLKLMEQRNIRLPMKAFVHQRYMTGELTRPINIPAVNANPYGGYMRPAAGNRVLVGGETLHREEFITPSLDFQMSLLTAPAAFAAELRENISVILPELRGTTWQSEKVGLISFSMDGEPIMGAMPDMPGLYVGAAFHSGGFAYNPVAGLLLAELALGEQTSINIEAFSPARFTEIEVNDYLSTIVRQEHAVARRH